MPHGQSLEFSGVTKRFGAVTAVSGLSARVEPGRVTGFLGPNGAGKTTTLRILLGLVRATEGTATIGGRRYAELDSPLQTVGAVLEASSFHPGRTAAAHLTIYAQAAGISKARVGEVLDLVGLTDAAGRKVGGFSLGMRQRLGLAYALIGDPGVLVLDEPSNGLDPEGIRWMRGFLRQLAAEGRTVLVSSHLLAEVQQTVDALLIISRGRLVFQGEVDELTDSDESATVVDAPDRAALTAALQAAGVPFEVLRSGLTVRGVDPTTVGAAAAAAGVALSSLHRRGPALEEVFLDLVNGTRVHASAGVGALSPVGATDAAAPAESDASAAAVAGGAAGVAAGAAVAAGAGADVEAPTDEDAEAEEAEESALSAAALDAEATGAPGAAASLAAAAGAAWADERRADEDIRRSDVAEPGAAESAESEPVLAVSAEPLAAEPVAEEPVAAEPVAAEQVAAADAEPTAPTAPVAAPAESGAAVPAAAADDVDQSEPVSEPDAAADAEPAGPDTPDPAATHGAVAGPQSDSQPDAPADSGSVEPTASEPPSDHDAEASPDADESGAPSSPTWAVASTGVIDVVPQPAAAFDPWAPEDSDPDVDAIGEIDDELSTPEPVDADDDRPWEHYEKTESDREADAFFAAFDHTANVGAGTAPETEPDGDSAPDTEPDAHSAPDTAPGPGAATDSEPNTDRDSAPDSAPDTDSDPGTASDADPAPEAQPEAWVPPEADPGDDAHDGPGTPEAGGTPADEASVADDDPAVLADVTAADSPESRDDEGGDR
ncbi:MULTISPECIES: ATP-binding cassette domain-containing protein [Microbacterium]|uniref:ATP-binding cassette domain-containing protein n=1 Tax=Microbacterium TaxID=33882 RepID=UPI000D65CBF3